MIQLYVTRRLEKTGKIRSIFFVAERRPGE
jgi:hypothetical protein